MLAANQQHLGLGFMNYDPTEEHIVRGTIQRITYHNPANGYSVLQLEVAEHGRRMTVVGYWPKPAAGAEIVARGVYKQHPRYGEQLSASSITETAPSSAEGIEKYLASGLIKGIGSKTARRLVKAFGAATFEVAHREPEKVAALVGKHKAGVLQKALAETQEVQEILRFLIEHNVSQALATKIHDRYGNRSIEIISRDPYLLARELHGVGFATADRIALNLGLKPDAPQRLKAGLYYALERAAEDGHCYLNKPQLMQKAAALLGLAADFELGLESHLKELCQEGFLLDDNGAVYLKHLHRAETFVADFISQRLDPRPQPEIAVVITERAVKQAEKELRVKFSAEQQEAVQAAARYRLLAITGGPGCGKTTVIKALAMMCRFAGRRLFLAAPTGRAAQRMAQVCQMEASTIHRLLRYDPMRKHFLFGVNQPLPADMVIIDESSMIDILLARDLFSAIPKEATLVLVGDKDQLPSVGPGRVFADIIAVQAVKTISLSKLFRRAEQSEITGIAHMINSGIVPQIPEPDGTTRADAYFIPRKDPAESAATIEKLVAEQLPKKFGFKPSEIMVLTPTNRGELGAEKLNRRLQNKLNPSGAVDPEQELKFGDLELRIKDRVCQRVNNYQIDEAGVFNGDIGEIYSIDRLSKSLVVDLWDGRLIKYSAADIPQLSLAYAITVHRAQGSESPCVVLGLHDSHYMLLERQLIYTAVTRAKKLLILVGSRRALMLAVKKTDTRRRCTLLKQRIQQALTT